MRCDIAILGGGPAGACIAGLLAPGGRCRIVVLDRPVKTDGKDDGRALALTHGSKQILKKAGLWAHLKPEVCPIHRVRVFDGTSSCALTLDREDLGKSAEALGWTVPAGTLLCAARTCLENLAAQNALTYLNDFDAQDMPACTDDESVRRIGAADGRTIEAALVIAADGRNSLARRKALIPARKWTYGREAVVARITHTAPHNFTAIEHFRASGPLAVLPMTDAKDGTHRSTVVLTIDPRKNKVPLDRQIRALVPDFYGDAHLLPGAPPPISWPLGHLHAYRYTAPRLALIADAAHGLHPAAAQGLNLGLRDAATLAELLLSDDGGQRNDVLQILKAYDRARRADNTLTAGATDSLVRIFGTGSPLVRLARRAGLRLLAASPAARRHLIRRATGAMSQKR